MTGKILALEVSILVLHQIQIKNMKKMLEIVLFSLCSIVLDDGLLAQCNIGSANFFQSYSTGSCNGMSFQSIVGSLQTNASCNGSDYTSILTSGRIMTNLAKNEELTAFKMYPNPASDLLYIEWKPKPIIINFKVMNVYGTEIISGSTSVNQSQIKIDLQSISSGIYFLIFNSSNTQILSRTFTKIN